MTSIEIYKIAQLYDLKMSLTNGMKNYTFDKARDFAVKFCDKNFSIYESDLVKSLIAKNILIRIEPKLYIKPEQYDEVITFIKENYSMNVLKFIELLDNDWSSAYNHLETLDDWIIIYQMISFARFYEKHRRVVSFCHKPHHIVE